MTVTAKQLALQARFSAEDAYKRAQSTADVAARAIANAACNGALAPKSYLYYYAQLCEAEQAAYERMRAAHLAATA